MEHAKEEKAVVLDFLQNGYPFDDGSYKNLILSFVFEVVSFDGIN